MRISLLFGLSRWGSEQYFEINSTTGALSFKDNLGIAGQVGEF